MEKTISMEHQIHSMKVDWYSIGDITDRSEMMRIT